MIIIIDKLACDGYGKCERIAPDLFKLDASGIAYALVEQDLSPEQLQRAIMTAKLCPTKAIRLADLKTEETTSE